MTTNKHDRKEGRTANIGFAKWRLTCFYDSLVQGSSLVFQMNICAENPPLRKAENRCASCGGDSIKFDSNKSPNKILILKAS
ncbi:MAG: hypothetical protein JST29_00080 [Bacteroidetes bacterium]|nr:hypothetical protein [Bacteroidota bacterium]